LNSNKNVVTNVDIEAIIAKMGPVDSNGASADSASTNTKENDEAAASSGTPKRLYRLPEGEWIAGVCNGIAAYFNIDATIVRVLFLLFTLLTHSWIGVTIYAILWLTLPVARTDDEKAHAYGVTPFNTHDFIQQATTRYAEFQKDHPNMPPAPTDPQDRESWKKWKMEMKAWKQKMKDWEKEHKREVRQKHRERNSNQYAWQNNNWQNNNPVAYAGMGFFRFLMGLGITAITILWIVALVDIAEHGTVFGLAIAAGHPLWMPIVFLCALFFVIVIPFKLLLHNARPHSWNRYSFFADLMQSIFFVFALYLLVWIGRELFPVVNEAWSVIVSYLQGLRL
jgi:phage shock protein PspC (stress-responsive transcriptional regulator)